MCCLAILCSPAPFAETFCYLQAVMRQGWAAGVKPVLVINKIDRLILEKEMDPIDAYYHIASVLEQVSKCTPLVGLIIFFCDERQSNSYI